VDTVQRRLLGQAASVAGFDTQKFETCLDSKAGAARVDADIAFGKEAGVSGTPSIFINGKQQTSGYKPDQIRAAIRELTEGAQTAVTGASCKIELSRRKKTKRSDFV
jgi:protein-disulfide isomerase